MKKILYNYNFFLHLDLIVPFKNLKIQQKMILSFLLQNQLMILKSFLKLFHQLQNIFIHLIYKHNHHYSMFYQN